MIRTNHHLYENWGENLNIEDRESDLSEQFLSEGSSAQMPLIIDSLEINMENTRFDKKKSIYIP